MVRFCTHQDHIRSFIKHLGYSSSKQFSRPAVTRVFLCRDKRQEVILKTIGEKNPWNWPKRKVYSHLWWENTLLEKARGIEGITHKINYYTPIAECGKKLVALVKEYVVGTELDDNLSESQYNYLRSTIVALHRRGIARIDLVRRNIIINSQGNPIIVDLGAIPKDKDKRFKESMKQDYEKLKDL